MSDTRFDPAANRAMLDYIAAQWAVLTRSIATLLSSAPDDKVTTGRTMNLYVAPSEDYAVVEARLRAELPRESLARVRLMTLPADPRDVIQHGLLYLPKPYVVPGGKFNEMYGWDSYFILTGLLRSGEVELARDMTDNALYQVRHYGKVLNANRTYYLDRSQPPFLSRMVLEVFRRSRDLNWLAAALPAMRAYHAYWTTGDRLTATGLSRYDSDLDTPCVEVMTHERDENGEDHYMRVRRFYRTHEIAEYDVARYYDRAADMLTREYHRGDRAMRASGFDVSNRFGPFNADIRNHAAVCLNALLYRMEMDLAATCTLLELVREAEAWSARARWRADAINRLMWDETAGLYFDYHLERMTTTGYAFGTAYFPLWAGIATPSQAARAARGLARFECAGGLQASDRITGNQWDAPFGWAPLQLIAVQGLLNYGLADDARRIARKFTDMVRQDFERVGTIKEKYDVVAANSETERNVRFGYASNEIGFGWTNAAILEFCALLAA